MDFREFCIFYQREGTHTSNQIYFAREIYFSGGSTWDASGRPGANLASPYGMPVQELPARLQELPSSCRSCAADPAPARGSGEYISPRNIFLGEIYFTLEIYFSGEIYISGWARFRKICLGMSGYGAYPGCIATVNYLAFQCDA